MDEHLALGSYVGVRLLSRLTARDALCGHLLLAVTDGRVSAEMRSSGKPVRFKASTYTPGLNFSHRANQGAPPPSAPVASPNAPLAQTARPSISDKAGVPPKPASAVVGPSKGMPAKPMAAAPKVGLGATKKGDAAAGPSSVTSPGGAAGASAQLAPRGSRGSLTSGQPSPAADAPKTDKPASASAGVKEFATKSTKSTPSTTPATLPKDKEAKKAQDKPANNGEKGEADGADSPKTGGQTPKRFSLYLKGLPTPTSEAEIKTFFGAEAEKVG